MLFRKFKTWTIIGTVGAGVIAAMGSLWCFAFAFVCLVIGGVLDLDMETTSSTSYSAPRKSNKEEFEEYQFYKIVNKK